MTSIVSIDDVKAHLNITGNAQDGELRRFMDAATAFVERHVGPVVPRSITETVYPTGRYLFLSAPIISLTSMTTAYGEPGSYSTSNWTIADRMLVATYGITATAPVTVVYQGGWDPVPADLYEATLDYIKWRWLSQRGPTPLAPPGEEYAVAASATVPYRVMEIIDGYRLPGFA